MSDPSPLHAYVHGLFREHIGDPTHTVSHDDHWALRPIPAALAINVLVNGGHQNPVIWVFDPYERLDGNSRTAVSVNGDADAVITQIQQLLKDTPPQKDG